VDLDMKKVYQWDARDYRESSSAQLQWARELLNTLQLRGNERILDIGCGDGKITAEIAKRLPNGSVVGIDSSEEMIKFSIEEFPQDYYPNLDFMIAEAQKLPFDEEFDVTFSNATLHWVIDHANVLQGIKRSLKPEGRILLQMGGRGNASALFTVLDSMLLKDKWGKFFREFSFPYGFYGDDDYRMWLMQAGLKEKRIELIPKDMTQKGKDGLASWIRTTWLPYTQRVSEALQDDFIQEIVDRYTEKFPPDGEGIIHVSMMRLEVEAMNIK
jgi:trans-aconitate 2-methyltransferase